MNISNSKHLHINDPEPKTLLKLGGETKFVPMWLLDNAWWEICLLWVWVRCRSHFVYLRPSTLSVCCCSDVFSPLREHRFCPLYSSLNCHVSLSACQPETEEWWIRKYLWLWCFLRLAISQVEVSLHHCRPYRYRLNPIETNKITKQKKTRKLTQD